MNQISDFQDPAPQKQQINFLSNFLQQQSDRLESQDLCFQQAITQIVWRADIKGELTHINQQWNKYTGLQSTEALGFGFLRAIHEEDREITIYQWQKAIETKQPYEIEFRLQQKDGKYHTFLNSAEPVRDKNGRVLEWLGTSTSLGKLKQVEARLQQKNRFLQTLLENLFDGIVACDSSGKLTLFNQAAQKLHQLPSMLISPEQWASYYDLYCSDGETPIEKEQFPLFKALHGEYIHNEEMIVVPKQGKARTLLTSGAPIVQEDDEKLGAVVVLRDITEQKQAREELAQLNKELEQRVIQRTSQLEIANRIKDELLLRERKARQEAELAKTHTKIYQDIVNNIQIGFGIWHLEDPEDISSFRLVAANPASSTLLGIDIEKEIGKPIRECFPNLFDKHTALIKALAEVFNSGQAIELEEMPYEDDRISHMIINIKVFPMPDRCVGLAFENITERKQIENALIESTRKYRSVVNSVREVIFQTDDAGYWQFLNPAWFKITGFPVVESLERHFSEYIHSEEQQQRSQELFQSLIAGERESFKLEFVLLTQNNELRTLEMNAQLNRNADGKVLGAAGTINDITERKEAQEALEARANELSQLNTILWRTTTQLEKRNHELDQFAYVTSHDLKAPLRAIANLSEWIEEDLEDKLDDDTREQMTLLRGRVHRMENLINGLLQYSRVGRITKEPETIDLNAMLLETIDSIAPAPEFVVEIVGQMPTLTTERLLIEQVFSNLISNAIKHHDRPDGKVEISVKEKGKFYEFAVKDDGPGIPIEYHEKVFGIFQTLEARDKVENTGIGLSIVKKIVETRGGKIHLSSELNRGTTFYFTWQKKD